MAKQLPSLLRQETDDSDEKPHRDAFPVGLHVSNEELEKMVLGDVKLGEERVITGVIRVTSVSSHKEMNGKLHKSVSMDLIEGITSDKPTTSSEGEKATALFGSDA